ncbi:Nuclear pore complex protein Nup85 [Sarcoptes scabiei]|uniref:Nuclear pore complex protein Nup85 n=1 Tax=Sarcoptes scabiei TaxID=52283 RepID=A0A132AM21_SARSC|nr:Nuclear pore complex protein Nup85 [Sarcoptes scabiei]KPM11635.1 nuclear pore complex protein Nup85-like protein [Sarcoptes scabiei]UXI21721.1 hypothetical protein NH340_JMT07664 [Sarcoptes scabiei]
MAKTPKSLIRYHSDDWLPQTSFFTDSNLRGFISESGVVFSFVQRVSNDLPLLSHSEMIKASRKYRSVIHSWYIKTIETNSGENEVQENHGHLMEQSKLLHQMEIVWHLCEILYINIPSAGTLLVQLLNWIKWHFTYYVELANEMILNDLPQMHPNYWDVIIFFALRGDMEHAQLFLELHPESKNDQAFSLVRDLLKKFPIITNNMIIHEYYLRWGFWHDNVVQLISQNSVPRSNKKSHCQLNLLLRLLSGDIDSFKEVSHLFHSWYQMMISYALFADPCLKGDTDELIEKVLNVYYQSTEIETMSPVDRLIRSSFNYDLIEVIKQTSLCFEDSWWFVTHFVDLIYNSSRYHDYQIADLNLIRDSFVTNYADTLFSRRKQFWQLSIEYLVHCKNSEQQILLCLERVPFDTQQELQRLLTTCRRFNFVDLERSLCRIESRKWIRIAESDPKNRVRFGLALFWAIRSKDKMLINYIVDGILYNCIENSSDERPNESTLSSLLDLDIISNIGGSIVFSERLIFLCKYCEFHQLFHQNRLKEAAKTLIEMFVSNAIPDFFQFQVLKDCLPLLQSTDSIIDVRQTCSIISSFEDLLYRMRKSSKTSSSSVNVWDQIFEGSRKCQRKIPPLSKEISIEAIEKFENQLRVATAYNLSKCFVETSD